MIALYIKQLYLQFYCWGCGLSTFYLINEYVFVLIFLALFESKVSK